MFYKQSVNNVEMVILCLDGGILDLNRLRYNYFNRICKQYNQSISKQQFASSLGNYKTMYTNSPINTIIDNDKINELIEKDLYEYAKLKQNIKKDGIDELLQFFRQKKIKVAVISTHKTKRAIQYLQLTQIYQYVDFVIGGDSDNLPLPNSSMLQTICNQMHVSEENSLVIANFPALVTAANSLFMSVVYIKDLIDIDSNISVSVYKAVKNNLEMINVFLFAKYDTVEIYSPLLGMSRNMDLATLEKTYQHLLLEYQDDPKLIELVKKTYRFFLMEINDTTIGNRKDIPINTVTISKVEEKAEEKSEMPESTIEITDVKNSDQTIDNIVAFASVNKVSKENPVSFSFEKEAPTINALMDKINGVEEVTSIHEQNNQEKQLDTANDIEKKGIFDFALDFIYVTIVSFITTFVSLLIYMVAEDFIQSKGIVSTTIKSIIDTYIGFVRICYTYFFDGLHMIVSFIPNYKEVISGNTILSSLAVEIIMFTVFNIIIFYIIKAMYYLVYKGIKKDD